MSSSFAMVAVVRLRGVAGGQIRKRAKAICVIGLKKHSRFGVFRVVDH